MRCQWMNNKRSKDLTSIAIMIAIIIVLGLFPPIPLGFLPVPIVLQNLGIMLSGALLGAKKGSAAVAGFLILAAIGFPVLTGGNGGLQAFYGPSSTYLFAYLMTAFLIGLARDHQLLSQDRPLFVQYLAIWIPGVLLTNLVGAIGMSHFGNMPYLTAAASTLVFYIGDSIKAFLVLILVKRLNKLAIFK